MFHLISSSKMPVARLEILPAAETIFVGGDSPYDNWNIFIFGRMPRLRNRNFVFPRLGEKFRMMEKSSRLICSARGSN
jgi:hypothetical protein